VPIAPNDFVHLHLHSEFSLLDGLGRIDDLVGEASAHGFDALAVTDHGSLYGAMAFYQACRARQIKPIIGVEAYVARRSMYDREGKADSQPYHVTLLAKDWNGYQNLCRIITAAHVDGYYYKPRLDRELLARHSEGIIGMSACLGGEVAKALEVDDFETARRVVGEYRDILGPDGFWLELMDHGLPEQTALNPKLLRLSRDTGAGVVATNDLHYVRKDQYEAHDVLLCVGTGSNLDTSNRLRFETAAFYLKTAAEMELLFKDVPEALSNSRVIADMTDLQITFGELRLPHFPVPSGYTVETWLRDECERGLRQRYGTVTDELRQRLEYELGVIISMGYAAYFLIVADFVRYAKEQGIATTCRGSAPGSIVTYTLGITPVDPILYGLPFERFLNPDRVTMPDIDVDFEDARRDEVINYVTRKYGQDHVAQIITFGTMLARAAVRDVGRVMGYGYGEVDRIAKAIPTTLGITLDEALQQAPPFREMYEGDQGIHKLIDIARQLEGVARNASTHAAGIVISREPLTELMPLQKATNSDALMTQYEMHGVEALGLLKFDFLGLSNLTILRQAVDLIDRHLGVQVDLDDIPLDDEKTFSLLSSGETTGVFQLESAGMRRYIRELRPSSVYDLAAMVALFRPGPMDNIPAYIRRKHGQEKVTYLHPLLEPYLAKTYGIFVYQEDIMAAAIALGGFTGPEADTLGYAIRKKKSDVLRAQKDKFVRQAAERGVEARVIDAVFKAFEPFERYGFNKAHATCYGLIAYQTAYLKANYPVEYMTSVLTAFRENTDKIAGAIAECRRLGIEVLGPDVRHSFLDFTVEGASIRFGLLAIKNVGEGAIRSIIEAREDGGEFTSLADLCARIDLRLVNKRVMEALIKVDALNSLGHPAQLLAGLDEAMAYGQAQARDRVTGQGSLFDMPGIENAALERRLPVTTEASSRERLRWEKELLGLYLSDHPLGELAAEMSHYVDTPTAHIGEGLDQQRVVVGGMAVGIRRVITRNGESMAVVTLEDLQGSVDVVVFPRTYAEDGVAAKLADDSVLLFAGRVDHKGDETVILADSVWIWDEVASMGEGQFAQAVAAGDRGRRGGRRRNGNGSAAGSGFGRGGGSAEGSGSFVATAPVGPATAPFGPATPVGPAAPARPAIAAAETMVIPRVSPLRGAQPGGTITITIGGGLAQAPRASSSRPPGRPQSAPRPPGPPLPAPVPEPAPLPHAPSPDSFGSFEPFEPLSGLAAPPAFEALAPDGSDEPPLPDDASAAVVRAAVAVTAPVEAGPDQVLHVRFAPASDDAIVAAFGQLKALITSRPGGTPVVLHIPAGSGRTHEMRLGAGIAYDADLLAEVDRRFDGLLRLALA
jgi:DNA polymerase III subunit alpha